MQQCKNRLEIKCRSSALSSVCISLNDILLFAYAPWFRKSFGSFFFLFFFSFSIRIVLFVVVAAVFWDRVVSGPFLWPSWNLPCRLGWAQIQRLPCLCLLSAKITGVHHHCPVKLFIYNNNFSFLTEWFKTNDHLIWQFGFKANIIRVCKKLIKDIVNYLHRFSMIFNDLV